MYGKGQMPEAQLVSREAFVNRYGVGQSVWQQLPAELLATVKPQIKENLLYLAKHHHALYQRDGDLLELDKAQAWYEALLVGFPNDPDTGENHLLYAESLFEEKQYQQAATAYQHAAYSYPIHERSAEAGYAVLLSLQLDTTLKDDQLASHLIESSAKYLESFPDDKRVAEVRHLKADQHIKLKDYHSAVTELDAVLLAQGAAMTALKGTVLSKLSLSHFILEDFLKAEQNSVMALQYETGTEQRKLLQERHAASIYKQAEQAQQAGDYAAAAEQFLRVGNLVPNASILAQAEYDGATAYISSSNWLAASKVLERFVARFSQHKLHLGAREKLAYVYGELGENTKAANSYGELASLEPDPERKLIWISQSADLHQQAGNFPQAIKMLNRYIEQLADRNMEYYEVMLRIAGIEQSLGKTSAYREKLEQVITLIDKQEPDLGIRQQGANAALTLGRSHHDEFLSIALKPPIKESLSKKNRSMKRAMEFYLQADEYRISDITTASTFYIGEIYSQLSHALLQSPVPAELDVDEKEMYQLMLEEQAFPFEEKSIGLHMVNTERVSKGIYDQWVKKSFKALGELQPGRYNKQETVDTIIAALN